MRKPLCNSIGRLTLAATVAALVAGCASTPAEDDPVQMKLRDLDARVAKIERIISNQSLVDLAQHLDQVQAEVRQLRGRIEVLENSTEGMKKQQKDLYNDLDKRIAALGGAPASGAARTAAGVSSTGGGFGAGPDAIAAAGAAGVGAAAGANGSSGAAGATPAASSVEQTVYAQSFDALKAGSYSVAITGFKDFLGTYPASPLAENAQYWLGEAYYVNRDFDAATGAFRNVLQKWPDSRKAPDALLKLGYTQFELKKYAEARTTLTEVTQKYPSSDAAKLATERLQHMPSK